MIVIDFGDKGAGLGRDGKDAELERRARTRGLLAGLPQGDEGGDASPDALGAVERRLAEAASTPEPLRPGLSKPLVEAWALTTIKEHPGRPDVDPWLRGWREEDLQATLAWREHLPIRQIEADRESVEPEDCARFFEAAPLGLSELLEMPAAAALKSLAARAAALKEKGGASAAKPPSASRIIALLLDRKGELLEAITLGDLAEARIGASRGDRALGRLTGGRLVISAELGGLRDGLLDKAEKEAAVAADQKDRWAELVGGDEGDARLPAWTVAVRQGEAPPATRPVFSMERRLGDGGEANSWLEVFRDPRKPSAASPWLSVRPVLLDVHEAAVADEARRIAEALLSDAEDIEAVALAGALHDHGKASPLWQRRMGAPADGAIYAKTRGGGGRGLDGYRHEFGSLLAASRMDLPDATRDLTLHLIAAHHGRARPGISNASVEAAPDGAYGQTGGPPSLFDAMALEAALRFLRLQAKHGPWGLAWREEMLRAADRHVSRRETEAAPAEAGEPSEEAA